MSSTLQRLFQFAKATGHDAIENFTTEALAAAVRLDPDPLARVLSTRTERYEVLTQVPIDGVGILDILVCGSTSFVIEVKVAAGESGDQLQRYVQWAAANNATVVLLAPRQLTDDVRVRWISWLDLRQAVRASATTCVYWTDLVTFLEEIGMADDSREPVDVEGSTIAGAHLLLKKMVHVLRAPAARVNELWPKSNWPLGDAEIKGQLARRFGTWPSFTISQRARFRAGISIGSYHDAQTDDAWLGIWIWAAPRRKIERDRLVSTLRQLPVSGGWKETPGEWEFFGAYQRLREFPSLDNASNWLIQRIDELNARDVFSVIEQLGAPAPDDVVVDSD